MMCNQFSPWAPKVAKKCESNIGMPVVRTDGRVVGVRSRDYQIFSDG